MRQAHFDEALRKFLRERHQRDSASKRAHSMQLRRELDEALGAVVAGAEDRNSLVTIEQTGGEITGQRGADKGERTSCDLSKDSKLQVKL